MSKKIEKAIKYAESTNKIEDLDLAREELEKIKKAILENKSQKSFLNSIVDGIKEKQNGKIK